MAALFIQKLPFAQGSYLPVFNDEQLLLINR